MTQYLLGVEWFESYLKLVCLKRDGQNFRLSKIEQLPLSSSRPEEVGVCLNGWAKTNIPKNESASVALTLPESSIFLKELELPNVKDKELSEAILWEISSSAPFPRGEAVVQWKKIDQGEKLTRVAVIIVRSQNIEDLLISFQDTPLKLQAVEPSSLAFSRLFEEKLKKTTLLVITEDEETNFVILKNGVPVFSTSTPTPLTGMATKRKRLNRDVVSVLAENAKKVIAFWEEKEKGKVQQVFITGKGIRYSGLARAINNFAHIPAVFARAQKFPKIIVAPQQKTFLERYLIPFGAAFRLAGPEEEEISQVNLLPQKERKVLEKASSQKKIAQTIGLFAKITFVFLLLSIVFLAGLKFWSASLEKEITQTRLFVNNHPAQKLVPQIQEANKLISQVGTLMAAQKDPGQNLEQISRLTPSNIRFTKVEFASLPVLQWEVTGVGDREAILAFYENLLANSGASKVSMPYSNLQKEKEADFKIKIVW
ncbi:MAG: hypothetical protein Q8P89_04995 [bacterium]|nr:hypothetical protein [bacterium]